MPDQSDRFDEVTRESTPLQFGAEPQLGSPSRVLLAYSLMQLSNISEFLYFQFCGREAT
jgi:hypothetical protein